MHLPTLDAATMSQVMKQVKEKLVILILIKKLGCSKNVLIVYIEVYVDKKSVIDKIVNEKHLHYNHSRDAIGNIM